MAVRHGRTVVLVVVAVLLVPLVWAGTTYRRQIWSYLTHWKGGPEQTQPYRPYTDPPNVHLAAVGDIGDSGTRLDATGKAMDALDQMDDYDALLLLGDLVYPGGDPDVLPDTVFKPFADVLDGGTDLYAILGNHDVKHGHGPEQMDLLGMTGLWWSTRIGDVQIVGLDSNDIDNPTQLDFLERELKTTDATWKIVLAHHPPYSAGYQGSSLRTRELIGPIAERYGVQLVLSGHDHDYQRSKRINGVTYVVSGAGAGTRRTGEADFTAVSYSWHHFLDLAVFKDRLVLRAVDQTDRVIDEVTLNP